MSQSFAVAASRKEQLLLSGGPVEPFRGFVLHDSASISERTEVVPGLFLSVTSEALEPLLQDEAVSLRFCLGYAGWGPGKSRKKSPRARGCLPRRRRPTCCEMNPSTSGLKSLRAWASTQPCW